MASRRAATNRDPQTADLPVGQVLCGDNESIMAGLPTGCCTLIYADPPFLTNSTRGDPQDAWYDDRWPEGLDGYLSYLGPRLEQMRRLLAAHGTLCLHVDWHVAHHARVLLDEIFGEDHFLNEIIWSYRTGGVAARWFARKHDNLYLYARTEGSNRFNLLREGAYRTDGLKLDELGRPYKQTRKGRLYFHTDGPAMTDVWQVPFLSTVSKERVGWPNQKPLALLERLVKACSDPDDLVADFFCGSGTTLVAAKRLGRRWLGCDEDAKAVKLAKARLAAAQAEPKMKPG